MSCTHLASATLNVPADVVFAHLCDPTKVGQWALGCMDLQASAETGVWRGRSLFDGTVGCLEMRAHAPLGLIDYWVGAEQGPRSPRICIRVHPFGPSAQPSGNCSIAMLAWRSADMSDARWERLQKTHDLEVLLIKAQIERDHAHSAQATQS